jgi:hypothetical protein
MARFTTTGGSGEGTTGAPGAPGADGSDGKDSLFLGTWNSVTAFLAIYQGGPVGLADGDWWAFVKDNTDPNKIYVVREDPNSATGWVIDDNEHFVLPQGPQGDPGANGSDGIDGVTPFNYQGEFDYGVTYAGNDAVTFQGGLWKLNNFIGAAGYAPTPGQWTLIIPAGTPGSDGADGNDGAQGPQGDPGSPGLVYLGNYVSGNGYIANLAVVKGSDNNLYIATSSGGLGDPVGNSAEWSILLPKGADGADANTGDITFDGSRIIGAGTGAGDGSGNGTIELVPDGDITSNQYLIIDPTGPNHIHIRAGGNQDASTADLIFGGERNKVLVSDSERLVLVSTRPTGEEEYENQWIFGSDGILIGPGVDNLLKVNGLYGKDTDPLFLLAPDTVVISGDGGEFLDDPTVADNQIATIGDLPTGATGTFTSQDNKTVTVTNGIITSIV